MVRKLDALQDDPSRKQVFHVHFTQDPPLTCIEAPMTVFAIAVVKTIESMAICSGIAESVMGYTRALHPEGYLTSAHGRAREDELTTILMAGWTSIEVSASSNA